MAKRVTMRVHSPRFPKFGRWETPRPELANSTIPPYGQRKDTHNSPSSTHHHHSTQFLNCTENNQPMPLAPTPAKNLHIRLMSVPMGSPHNSQHQEAPLLVDPLLTPQHGTPNQPQKVLRARIVFSPPTLTPADMEMEWNY